MWKTHTHLLGVGGPWTRDFNRDKKIDRQNLHIDAPATYPEQAGLSRATLDSSSRFSLEFDRSSSS